MPVLIKNMTSNNETSIISTSVSDPVPDPDSGFFWIWIRIEFLAGSGSGFDEYVSKNTD